MDDERKLKKLISSFDREEHQGSYAEECAKIYGRRVRMRTLLKGKSRNTIAAYAEEGFILGFIWARTLEGY